MPLKKYINGSWVDTSYKRYETGTDAVTTLPVEIFTDGQPVSSYTLKGNTSVSGTPSPQNPVTISGVGNETANLFNIADLDAKDRSAINDSGVEVSSDFTGYTLNYIDCKPDTDYTIYNTVIASNGGYYRLYFYDISKNFISRSASYVFMSKPLLWQLRSPANAYYFQIQYGYTSAVQSWEYLMILEGLSVPDHYIPYGYEISILKDLQALTPIYLTAPLMKIDEIVDTASSSGTVNRVIKKLVLTGEETWTERNGGTDNAYFATSVTDGISNTTPVISSHFVMTDISSANTEVGIRIFGANLLIRPENASTTTKTAFSSWLAEQYSAGTPVTVYYVLATATTESVTAPSITTTGGEVSIDVDTTVKPSEFDLTYHGWHEHEPLKRENGSWS